MSHAVDEATTHIKASLEWLRGRLFFSWSSSIATLLILYPGWTMVPPLIDWAFVRAVWAPRNAALCRAVIGDGACWAFIAEKYRFILFGTFPADQHWRPALTVVILLMLYLLSALRNMKRSRLAYFWLAGLAAIGVLMWGGVFGLSYVENERWGGLTLTLLLATFGLAFAFPLSLLLALGRRSAMPVVRWLSIAYIELIRGVPLISVLFMASVMLPLFLPPGLSIDKLLRAQLAMIFFCRRLSRRSGARRTPGHTAPARRSGPSPRTELLATDLLRHPATSTPHRDSAFGQHLHRLFQGHLPRCHHRPFRLSDDDQSFPHGA